MILFLIIYLIGYITSLILLIWQEPQYVTLGDLIMFLFESLLSWISVLFFLIFLIIDNLDTKIIIKKISKK